MCESIKVLIHYYDFGIEMKMTNRFENIIIEKILIIMIRKCRDLLQKYVYPEIHVDMLLNNTPRPI